MSTLAMNVPPIPVRLGTPPSYLTRIRDRAQFINLPHVPTLDTDTAQLEKLVIEWTIAQKINQTALTSLKAELENVAQDHKNARKQALMVAFALREECAATQAELRMRQRDVDKLTQEVERRHAQRTLEWKRAAAATSTSMDHLDSSQQHDHHTTSASALSLLPSTAPSSLASHSASAPFSSSLSAVAEAAGVAVSASFASIPTDRDEKEDKTDHHKDKAAGKEDKEDKNSDEKRTAPPRNRELRQLLEDQKARREMENKHPPEHWPWQQRPRPLPRFLIDRDTGTLSGGGKSLMTTKRQQQPAPPPRLPLPQPAAPDLYSGAPNVVRPPKPIELDMLDAPPASDHVDLANSADPSHNWDASMDMAEEDTKVAEEEQHGCFVCRREHATPRILYDKPVCEECFHTYGEKKQLQQQSAGSAGPFAPGPAMMRRRRRREEVDDSHAVVPYHADGEIVAEGGDPEMGIVERAPKRRRAGYKNEGIEGEETCPFVVSYFRNHYKEPFIAVIDGIKEPSKGGLVSERGRLLRVPNSVYFLQQHKPSFWLHPDISDEDQRLLLSAYVQTVVPPNQHFDNLSTALEENFGEEGMTLGTRTIQGWEGSSRVRRGFRKRTVDKKSIPMLRDELASPNFTFHPAQVVNCEDPETKQRIQDLMERFALQDDFDADGDLVEDPETGKWYHSKWYAPITPSDKTDDLPGTGTWNPENRDRNCRRPRTATDAHGATSKKPRQRSRQRKKASSRDQDHDQEDHDTDMMDAPASAVDS